MLSSLIILRLAGHSSGALGEFVYPATQRVKTLPKPSAWVKILQAFFASLTQGVLGLFLNCPQSFIFITTRETLPTKLDAPIAISYP